MNDSMRILEFVRLGGIVSALLVLVVAYFVVRLGNEFAARLARRFADRRFLIEQTSTFARFAVYLVAIAVCVPLVFQLTDEMLLAVGGTIAVTIGFALKDVASSLLAGITILMDKPFQVGDRVSFGDVYGEVTAIGLRSVRLVTLDDKLVTIPNNKFLTEAVASGNAGGNEMLVQMEFHVLATEDVRRARELVHEAVATSPYVTLSRPLIVFLREVVCEAEVLLRLRVNAYVFDVRYEKQLESDATERVVEALQRAGVAPYGTRPSPAVRAAA